MIQKDKWRSGQGYRDILGWAFVCECCGFKSHVYKSKATVVAIEDEHFMRCLAFDLDLTAVTIVKPKAVSKARLPV